MASRRTLAQVGESETEVPAGFLDGDLELVEPSAQHEATTSVRSTRVVPTRSGTSSKESQPDPDSTCCAEPEGEFDHTADVKLPSPVELECADELDINLLFALMPVFFDECTRSHHSFHSHAGRSQGTTKHSTAFIWLRIAKGPTKGGGFMAMPWIKGFKRVYSAFLLLGTREHPVTTNFMSLYPLLYRSSAARVLDAGIGPDKP